MSTAKRKSGGSPKRDSPKLQRTDVLATATAHATNYDSDVDSELISVHALTTSVASAPPSSGGVNRLSPACALFATELSTRLDGAIGGCGAWPPCVLFELISEYAIEHTFDPSHVWLPWRVVPNSRDRAIALRDADIPKAAEQEYTPVGLYPALGRFTCGGGGPNRFAIRIRAPYDAVDTHEDVSTDSWPEQRLLHVGVFLPHEWIGLWDFPTYVTPDRLILSCAGMVRFSHAQYRLPDFPVWTAGTTVVFDVDSDRGAIAITVIPGDSDSGASAPIRYADVFGSGWKRLTEVVPLLLMAGPTNDIEFVDPPLLPARRLRESNVSAEFATAIAVARERDRRLPPLQLAFAFEQFTCDIISSARIARPITDSVL